MNSTRPSVKESRDRILLLTHCFDANFSMESRLSWFRAVNAAQQFDVTVICAKPYADIRCELDANIEGLQVVSVPHTPLELQLNRTASGFYLAYRLWHRRVFKVAQALHRERPFRLVHQVSYCGYREPGECWRLGVPFVWGPIGGTQDVPWKFLGQLRLLCAVKELVRSTANAWQLRWGSRVGKALNAASAVYVANREVQADFHRARGVMLPCQLETGLEDYRQSPKPERDPCQPLRILWAGRLESWKGLPLLLRAIAKLPKNLPFEVRVLGTGMQQKRWQRLARRLGIAAHIQWVPLPKITQRDEHYHWADVFAFTSLRDTSGTGLLEALGAGVPIVGLDHQGARDIMTPECALPIAVTNPTQASDDFRDALVRLQEQPRLLARLSEGATKRARKFSWDQLSEEMLHCYREAIDGVEIVVPDFHSTVPVTAEELPQVVG